MAWDSSGRYYYRHTRIAGKPRRVYVGGGLLGALAAMMDGQEQAQRVALDAQRRLQRTRDREAHRSIDAQYQQVRAWAAALLTAAGCYRHKREWRRMDLKAFAKRYREAEERDAAQAAGKLAHGGGAAQLAGPTVTDGGAADRSKLAAEAAAGLEALVKRVNGPKPSRADLDTLRDLLAVQSGDNGIITVLDGSTILHTLIDSYTDSEASRLVMRADARRMADRLGRDAPPFERPLIDHIVTCWVRLQLVERDHANNLRGAHSRESGQYWDRRLSEAQRRYLRAVNLLAKLRHLGPVQINVADKMLVMNNRQPD